MIPEYTYIYALKEPMTGIIRYIGKADDLAERLGKHIRNARRSRWGNLLPKEPLLRSTDDRDVRALLTKALYKFLNLWPLPCRKDYYCHWMYPYGFVPEAGCPYHD